MALRDVPVRGGQMRLLLILLALAVVGCGGDDGDALDPTRFNGLDLVDAEKWSKMKSLDPGDDFPRPDYVARDSFIVGYDTTGCEMVGGKVRVYGVTWDSLQALAEYYGGVCSTATGFVGEDDWSGTIDLPAGWQFITVPIYAPKVVVQLTPDKAAILNQILEACVNYDTSYGEFVVYISQKALDSTAENGQHEN